jgi:hypothetical protein
MPESQDLVGYLERSLEALRGTEIPLETLGDLLERARRLYLAQLDPDRIYCLTGQPFGPVVARDEVLPPFDPNLLARLGQVISTAETALEGINLQERRLMRMNLARIPTQSELNDDSFRFTRPHSLDPEKAVSSRSETKDE